MVQPLWKTVYVFPQLKTELPYDTSVPSLGILKAEFQSGIFTHVHSSTINNSQTTQ